MRPFLILILKEIKDIFLSKTAILFLILTSYVIGNSFVMAVDLYSKASETAIHNPLYASGFEPVRGVFIPTFGGLFMIFSLFLPFVIIPLISNEKKGSTLSILTQLPFSFKDILISKIVASILFMFFVLALTIPSFMLWKAYGGHIAYGEVWTLFSGYLLYGLLIISISLCFAALFENTANAAIFSIAIVISSWVIDFAKSANTSNLISQFSEYTFTKMLKPFESGIFSLRSALYFVFLSVFFLSLSYIFLRFDLKHKWKWITTTIIIFTVAMPFITKINVSTDMTESRRNSFAPNVAKALKKIPDLSINIHLKNTDSRYKDYEYDFLSKLNLIRSDVKIKMVEGSDLDNNYGLFTYKVSGKSASTYSNSEEEIFPIIFGLAGINAKENGENPFSGYPLVATKKELSVIRYIYYLIIPLICLLIFIGSSKTFSLRRLKDEIF